MKWMEYVVIRAESRVPKIPFGQLPYAEYQQWYRDYRSEYPEDEAKHRFSRT